MAQSDEWTDVRFCRELAAALLLADVAAAVPCLPFARQTAGATFNSM